MKQGLILITLLIIVTAIIAVIRPQMHSEIRIVNTEFSFFNTENPKKTVQTSVQPANVTSEKTTSINTVKPAASKQSVNIAQQNQTNIAQKTALKKVEQAKTNVKTKVIPSSKTEQTKVNVQPAKNKTTETKTKVSSKPAVKTVQNAAQSKTPSNTTTKSIAVQNTPVKTTAAKKAEEQEAISWNKWRANVHNRIIAQVNLPTVPAGTVFTYSFTVSSSGAISNVRTSSTSPQYTAYAIQYIAPVVRKSAYSSFLAFPAGTNRQSVNVEYKFRTTDSGSGSQASASNFNDVEIIKK